MDHTRTALGVLTLVAFGIGLWAWTNGDSPTAGIAVRTGLVLGAVWLAWPSMKSLSWRTALLTLGAVAVMVWRPRSAWLVIPVMALTLGRRRRTAE